MKRNSAALIVALAAMSACIVQSGLPAKVTAASVRSVKLGMTQANLELLLGPPVAVESVEADCHGSQGRLLTYFREPALKLVVKYPKVWVYVCQGVVSGVKVRDGDPVDDEDVFILRPDLEWESPGFAQLLPSGTK